VAITASEIRKTLRSLGDPAIAEHSQRFFRTGKGEYGEGDRFLGIRVPVIRAQVRKFRDASIGVVAQILKSPWHEERLFSVLSLADRFKRSGEQEQRRIFDVYIANIDRVNNWDLVDGSAHLIVGPWLEQRSRRRLYSMARSRHLWTRRIAIMSTYHYIKNGEFDDTLALAEILLQDDHDLIHKATGWMLREVGNRDREVEEQFLKKHYREMPRTMLRYAIEKFPEKIRKAYLHGNV
jgi:3-methyladenine DNA glycosylase AlkD